MVRLVWQEMWAHNDPLQVFYGGLDILAMLRLYSDNESLESPPIRKLLRYSVAGKHNRPGR